MDEKKRLERLRNKPLTRRQEKFVKEIVSNDGLITAREAAVRAGYPAGSAHTRAYELLNSNLCPHVTREIERYRAELDERYEVGYKRHVRDLQILRDKAMDNGAWSAAVQAERLRGMAQGGIYVARSEVRHGSIESLSRSEVEHELERIRQNFEKNILDITPDEEPEQDATGGAEESGSGVVADLEEWPALDETTN